MYQETNDLIKHIKCNMTLDQGHWRETNLRFYSAPYYSYGVGCDYANVHLILMRGTASLL